MIWFDFPFVLNLVIILFKSIFFFFLIPFFCWIYFFNFILNYFGWVRIWYKYFFGFAFYVVIQPHDPCYKFWRLNWVGFSFFLIFYLFHPSSSGSLKIGTRYFSNFSLHRVITISCSRSLIQHVNSVWLESFFSLLFIFFQLRSSILGWFDSWVSWFHSVCFSWGYLDLKTRL